MKKLFLLTTVLFFLVSCNSDDGSDGLDTRLVGTEWLSGGTLAPSFDVIRFTSATEWEGWIEDRNGVRIPGHESRGIYTLDFPHLLLRGRDYVFSSDTRFVIRGWVPGGNVWLNVYDRR